jgi:hypothetical protein
MPLSVTVGQSVFPLDPDLVTQGRLREVADPLSQTFVDLLKAALNAEMQGILDKIKNDLGSREGELVMPVAVREAIPANPELFLKDLSWRTFPLLAVYRSEWVREPWMIDNQRKRTTWTVDYILPELETFQYGKWMGGENAIDNIITHTLRTGAHSSYDSGANIYVTSGILDEITFGPASSANWQLADRDRAILFPALRLQFVTVESITDTTSDAYLDLEGLDDTGSIKHPDEDAVIGVVSEVNDLDA